MVSRERATSSAWLRALTLMWFISPEKNDYLQLRDDSEGQLCRVFHIEAAALAVPRQAGRPLLERHHAARHLEVLAAVVDLDERPSETLRVEAQDQRHRL